MVHLLLQGLLVGLAKPHWLSMYNREKKSRIRETSNLSTDADRRTDTILERLRDLSKKKKKKKNY